MDRNPNSSKADRKTIEKNRRNQMKALYSKLTSLVPHQSPREVASIPDQLECATNYVKKLQMNLEKMKQKRSSLKGSSALSVSSIGARSSSSNNVGGLKSPNIDVRVTGSIVEVVVITGLNCQFMFSETIRMLYEEGAEVVSASFSVQDNAVFHTIHSKFGESAQVNGAARISERLRKFVDEVN